MVPQTIIADLPTTAAKIRALAASGMARAEIARFLGVSYQHVRNTLAARAPTGAAPAAVESAAAPCRGADLLQAGFAEVGQWVACAQVGMRLSGPAPAAAGVYAFLVDDQLCYVGVTQQGLRARLAGYARGDERQRTNARLKRLICECVGQGQQVTILAAFPDDLEWNGLPVNGAAGLEYGLIRRFRPRWNQMGA